MINMINSIGYTQPVKNTQTDFSQTLLNSASDTKKNNGKDSVSISNEGKFNLITDLFPKAGKDYITVDMIRDNLNETTSYVEKELQAIYQKLGIESGNGIEFSVGYHGNIIVKGDDESAEMISEAVNNNHELSNNIRRMSADTSLLKAIEDYLEFSAAYEKNPELAVSKYGWMLQDGHGYDVTFFMENGVITSETKYL